MTIGRAAQATRTAAATVVVAAGIKLAAPMLAPFLLALFIATVTAPLVFWLRRRRFPNWLAIGVGIFVDVLAMGTMTLVIAGSLSTFYQKLPVYQERATLLLERLTHFLANYGVELGSTLDEAFRPEQVLRLIVDLLGQFATIISQSLIVLLTVGFLLIEITSMRPKLEAVMRDEKDLEALADAAKEANTYLLVKSVVSIATGTLVGVTCAAFGLDFPLLWGLIAYLLNYIPTIGSFIAAGPPIVLALVMQGVGPALGLMGIILAINVLVGSIIEPKITGDVLGLATLVVFLSVIAWGFLLGPIGALLSAPLTLILKRWLAHTDDWAFVATLLGRSRPLPSGRRVPID